MNKFFFYTIYLVFSPWISSTYAVASTKFCLQVLTVNSESLPTETPDPRLGELQLVIGSVLSRNVGSYETVLKNLELLLRNNLQTAVSQIPENAILAESAKRFQSLEIEYPPRTAIRTVQKPSSSGWWPFSRSTVPHVGSTTPPVDPTTHVRKLQLASEQLKTERIQILQALQRIKSIETKLQQDVLLIEQLKAWLKQLSKSSEKLEKNLSIAMELDILFLDLNSQIETLQAQIRFLESQVAPLTDAAKNVSEQKKKVDQFLTTQGVALLAQNNALMFPAGAQRFPQDLPQVSEETRAKAFNRPFHIGDRLILTSAWNSQNQLAYSYYESKREENGRLVAGLTAYLTPERPLVKPKKPFFRPRPPFDDTPVKQFIEIDLNQYQNSNRGGRIYLANPNLKIGNFQLNQTVEIDLQRAQQYLEDKGYLSEVFRTIVRSFTSDDRMSFSSKHDLLLFMKSERRIFLKLLGTNPIGNTIGVAVWTYTPATAMATDPLLREMPMSELDLLKTLPDLAFHWPQFDHLDADSFKEAEE